MTRPSHSSWFDHPNNINTRNKIRSVLISNFTQLRMLVSYRRSGQPVIPFFRGQAVQEESHDITHATKFTFYRNFPLIFKK
jgi:hypothetical protein